MRKNSNNSVVSRVKHTNITRSSLNLTNDFSPLYTQNWQNESNLLTPYTYNEQPSRIIHRSTEQSIDKHGNKVIKIKTIREIGGLEKRKIINQVPRASKHEKRFTKITKTSQNDLENQKYLYKSPDYQSSQNYQGTNNVYNNIKVKNSRINMYKENYNGNANRCGTGNYRDEIDVSPIMYDPNYSSYSEFDENQMKSFDNYQLSKKYKEKYNMKKGKKNEDLNYELEDVEKFDYISKNDKNKTRIYEDRSEIIYKLNNDSNSKDRKDFQSPDRNIPNNIFRNVTINMIDSKGPSNEDKKITKIMTKKIEQEVITKRYTRNNSRKKINKFIKYNEYDKIRAAKIIQAWWRRTTMGKEGSDITNIKIIQLQSIIRGYLIRKKVCRFITLSMYYQTFCEKLQEILSYKIKKEIFQLLKQKFSVTRRVTKNITERRRHLINTSFSNISSRINDIPLVPPVQNTYVEEKNTNKNTNKSFYRRRNIINIQVNELNKKFKKNENKNIKMNYSFTDGIFKRNNDKGITKKEISNHTFYSRVENNERKNKGFSPNFGILNKKKDNIPNITKNLKKNNHHSLTRKNNSFVAKTNDNIEETVDTTRRIIRNITSSSNLISQSRNSLHLNKYKINTDKNEMISGGTLSIIKLPNKKLSYSETEDVYNNHEEKISFLEQSFRTTSTNPHIKTVGNQVSLSYLKFPEHQKKKDEKNKYSSYGNEKNKEKIIIVKESEPETVEEGNDFQIFDMKVSKRVALSIKPSVETREIIKKELKEIEIIKQKEKERIKEINKYKKDIKIHKLNNKIVSLKNVIRICEYWKEKILKKKFLQFKKNVFSIPKIFEIQTLSDIQFKEKPKQKRDMSVQHEIQKVDEYSQSEAKIEPANFKNLEISKSRIISFDKKVVKKPKKPNIITSSKLNILSKIPKKEKTWKTEISNLNNELKILSSKPKTQEEGSQYIKEENKISQNNEIKFIKNKPELKDSEVQHEPETNCIDRLNKFEIKCEKPASSEVSTQIEIHEPKIIKDISFTTKGIKIEKILPKVETTESGCNAIEDMEDKGIQNNMEEVPKIKNIEVKLFTVKRSIVKLEIPLLKKLWLKKAFRTFRDNCQRPLFHQILGKEFLRMALLRWRFKNGYGPDRYGNAYDRDGNLLYHITGKVCNAEVQQDFSNGKKDMDTQYIPIDNIISTLKQIEIGPAYQRKKEPEKMEQGVGENNSILQSIEKGGDISILSIKKELQENKIIKNENLEIKNIEKKLKDEETEIIPIDNQIINTETVNISAEEEQQKKLKKIKFKELITNLLYKKIIIDKLSLNDAFHQWTKQNILISQKEKEELEKIKNENLRKEKLKLTSDKQNDINIYSDDYIFQEEIKKGIHHEMTEEQKQKAYKILYKFIISQNNNTPLLLKKYLKDWARRAKYLLCVENANIIKEFCKKQIKSVKNEQKWKKITKKLIIKEKIKIIKISKIVNIEKNKIFDLIRITRINSIYAKRRYLHYIIISWLIYTRNIKKKRAQIKLLYENMLNTYIYMADDVFGNNQETNPSVQDAFFEAIESGKFQTKELHDVPLAEKYYSNKNKIQKLKSNKVNYINEVVKTEEIKENIFMSQNVKEKTIKINDEEKLKSRGRGRAFRTEEEKEILSKFSESKKSEDDEFFPNKKYGGFTDKKNGIKRNLDKTFIRKNLLNPSDLYEENNKTNSDIKKNSIYFSRKYKLGKSDSK